MPSASATEDPPYFCTTMPTDAPALEVKWLVRRAARVSLAGAEIAVVSAQTAAGGAQIADSAHSQAVLGRLATGSEESQDVTIASPVASSRSCATTDCNARSTADASPPHDDT